MDVKIFKSHSDIKKAWGANANVDVAGGIFSASASYESLKHSIHNSSQNIEDVTSFFSTRQVDMYPMWMWDSEELNRIGRVTNVFIKRLPKKLESKASRNVYKRFIKLFGTHYPSSGKFGGLIRAVMHTKKSYYSAASDRKVKAEAKALFFKILKIGGGGSSQTTKVDSRFLSSTSHLIRYLKIQKNLVSQFNLHE